VGVVDVGVLLSTLVVVVCAVGGGGDGLSTRGRQDLLGQGTRFCPQHGAETPGREKSRKKL